MELHTHSSKEIINHSEVAGALEEVRYERADFVLFKIGYFHHR